MEIVEEAIMGGTRCKQNTNRIIIMKSLNEYVIEYVQQLEKGAIRKALIPSLRRF